MSEEFAPDFYTVADEEGNEFELELLDTLELDDVIYHAFFPAVEEKEGEPVDIDADDEEQGLVILKVVVEADGEEVLSTLDSDEEMERVYTLFMERLFAEEEDGE